MSKTFDERELSPIFVDPNPVISKILSGEPSKELLQRLQERGKHRSPTEQPSKEERQKFLQKKGVKTDVFVEEEAYIFPEPLHISQ